MTQNQSNKVLIKKILNRYAKTLMRLAESEKIDLNKSEDSNGSRRGNKHPNQQEKLENKDC
jgi:hypothetical protein